MFSFVVEIIKDEMVFQFLSRLYFSSSFFDLKKSDFQNTLFQ